MSDAPPQKYHRKIIHISALDSPSVKLGLLEKQKGLKPSHRELVKGAISYRQYVTRMATYDVVRRSISILGQFWEGAELLLFPPEWLDAAHEYHKNGRPIGFHSEKWLGVDPGEGGDETAWAVVDEWGLVHIESRQTPDTTVIPGRTRELMRQYVIRGENVLFDRGGGGKQIADAMRANGFQVQTIGFGDGVSQEYDEYLSEEGELDVHERRYQYKNRRAEMYGELSNLLDPGRLALDAALLTDGEIKVGPNQHAFAIPADLYKLRQQLAPIPKSYDGEGRQYLIPKNKPTPTYKGPTLRDLIGQSPDQADALVLAVHGMLARDPGPAYYVAGQGQPATLGRAAGTPPPTPKQRENFWPVNSGGKDDIVWS